MRAVDGGFEVDGHGVYPHVLLAPGHPGLAWPEGLEDDPRAVHAYEPHEFEDTVEIVGAGMAAATEWLNALDAGASVISVRRREPERRPLNLPRVLFSRRGLAGFHKTPPDERVGVLERFGAPSYPAGSSWDEPVEAARRAGRFHVSAELNGAPQVVRDRLQARVPARSAARPAGRRARARDRGEWIVLTPDSTVGSLTDETRTLTLAGVPAQWAFPAADTLMGAKYAARRFARKVAAWRTR